MAIDVTNLAWMYLDQGKFEPAESSFQRALKIREKVFGPDHPDVADSLENYAGLLRETGRPAEAAKLETRAAEIRAGR